MSTWKQKAADDEDDAAVVNTGSSKSAKKVRAKQPPSEIWKEGESKGGHPSRWEGENNGGHPTPVDGNVANAAEASPKTPVRKTADIADGADMWTTPSAQG